MSSPLRALLVIALALVPSRASGREPSTAAAERLYREGVLPSGQPLRGEREGGTGVKGQTAACATCHRRSGLGSWEGQSVIPPIIGRYLFRPGARIVEDEAIPHVQGFVPRKDAYTEATLARAIRDGVDPRGRKLGYLMPRYRLDEPTMASLISYLKGLTADPVPGVTRDTLHFATIVTPDADPTARDGMLAVLRQFFSDKNAGYRGESRPMQSTRGVMYRVLRKWKLHVWELSGPPETWEQQLDQKLVETPVFAVISGIGGTAWKPVHRFCERASLPCLFPNVDLPVTAEQDFYPVYFSRGILLEADLVAARLGGKSGGARSRVIQIYRSGDIGEEAAQALSSSKALAGATVVTRPLGPDARGPELQAALRDAGTGDAVMLWLRPADLALLPATPPAAGGLFLSGLMGGLERAPLPPGWRFSAQMTYPFDLPDVRKVRMDFPLGWFRVRQVPVVAERIQTDTYLSCAILSETLGHMLDSFVRDYLVERLEMLLSHRLVNGYYPRLGLAPGQRFASKGGHLVRFVGAEGTAIVSDSGWRVP